MKKRTSNGRTFYRILVTLLSCVLIMAALTVFLISYQNRRSVKTHTDMLANAMTNGAAQIDGFWQNAAAFLASLSDSTQLARLSTQPQLNLRLAAEAQSSVTKSLSSYLSGVDCANDVFLYLYGKDYLLTPTGVTQLDTYFNNRYVGDMSEFTRLLRGVYPFELRLLPFKLNQNAPSPNRQSSYASSDLVLLQTLYANNRAVGTLVMALEHDALVEEISRYLTIPNSTACLFLNGVVLGSATDERLTALPAGEYSRYIEDVGVVVRRRASVMRNLEYLAVDGEENILPENGRIVQMLLLLLAAATLGMGAAAFFATRKLYTPLRTLMSEFDNPVDSRTDECKLLLQSIQSVNSNYASAQHALDYSSPLIRDALLYHLLRDPAREDDPLMKRYLPAPFRQEHFYVFAVSAVLPAAREDEPSGAAQVIAQLKRQGGPRLLSTLRTGNDEFALITYPLPPQEHARLCEEFAGVCARLEKDLPGGIVVCACGAGVAHIDCIDACFREACAILRSRPITCEYSFLGGPDGESAAKPTAALLPADYANTLSALLRGGDFDRAWAYMDDLLQRSRRPDVTAAQYVKMAVTLNQQLFWAASGRVPSPEDRMIELEASNALMPADQIVGILRDNLRILLSAETPRPQGGDRENLTRYICDNIASGINLSAVADHFGYNANYFSRYFKQLTGVTFTAYLNRAHRAGLRAAPQRKPPLHQRGGCPLRLQQCQPVHLHLRKADGPHARRLPQAAQRGAHGRMKTLPRGFKVACFNSKQAAFSTIRFFRRAFFRQRASSRISSVLFRPSGFFLLHGDLVQHPILSLNSF